MAWKQERRTYVIGLLVAILGLLPEWGSLVFDSLLKLHKYFDSTIWNVWLVYAGLSIILYGLFRYRLLVRWREYITHYPARDQFEEEYRQQKNEDSRERLRRTIVKAYAEWKKARDETQPQVQARIVNLVELAPFPADLPLSNEKSLRQWAYTNPTHWENEAKDLWDFSVSLFPEDGSTPKLLLSDDDYASFWAARKTTAKFWDRWGKSIVSGELRPEDVEHQLDAHKKDLKMLVYLEAALSRWLGWDDSAGKEGLFKLARDQWVTHPVDKTPQSEIVSHGKYLRRLSGIAGGK